MTNTTSARSLPASISVSIGTALLCQSLIAQGASVSQQELHLESLTVEEIRVYMLEDGLSCSTIVKAHLNRIDALDRSLHSVIAIDPSAVRQAEAIDKLPRAEQRKLSLLCVPTLVKDNIDVAGLPTTAGSKVFEKNFAPKDAEAVSALRAAGAIVVAKTNMSEFAFNYKGASAVGGRTLNPYDSRLSAGGSSSGNAAGLAAGFGVVALGTDTSGSIRVPSAVTGLVGLRPTINKLNIAGVLALSPSQDVIGPMCRTAEDCNKAFTALLPESNDRAVSGPDAWKGVRIGVLRGLFPATQTSRAFVNSIDTALDHMRSQGAVLEEVTLDDEQVLVGNVAPKGETAKFMSRSAYDFPSVINAYLSERKVGLNDYEGFVERLSALNVAKSEGDKVLDDVRTFGENYRKREADARYRINGSFRDDYVLARLRKAMGDGANARFDVLLYPSVQGFNDTAINGPNTGGTHRLSAYSGYPAIAFPVGWTRASQSSGLEPVGIELLARPGEDQRLLRMAMGWAKFSPARPAPAFKVR